MVVEASSGLASLPCSKHSDIWRTKLWYVDSGHSNYMFLNDLVEAILRDPNTLAHLVSKSFSENSGVFIVMTDFIYETTGRCVSEQVSYVLKSQILVPG